MFRESADRGPTTIRGPSCALPASRQVRRRGSFRRSRRKISGELQPLRRAAFPGRDRAPPSPRRRERRARASAFEGFAPPTTQKGTSRRIPRLVPPSFRQAAQTLRARASSFVARRRRRTRSRRQNNRDRFCQNDRHDDPHLAEPWAAGRHDSTLCRRNLTRLWCTRSSRKIPRSDTQIKRFRLSRRGPGFWCGWQILFPSARCAGRRCFPRS
jgi:hypothetical protein